MSKHTITIEVELSEASGLRQQEVLENIAGSMTRAATEGWGIASYYDGKPEGHGGYEGPFVISAGRHRTE